MNQIMLEQEKAKGQMLNEIKADDGSTIVELSIDNVAKVEAMIQNDSAYIKSSNKDAKPFGKYNGSTAYWMTKLKPIIFEENESFIADNGTEYSYDKLIQEAVNAVDRENTTHINSDGCGRYELSQRIIEMGKKKVKSDLKNSGLNLFNQLAEPTVPTDEKHHSRINISFASKFCHYACMYWFEGEPEQDNYSIWDRVLEKALPLYLNYYEIKWKQNDIKEYELYRKLIDTIINKSESGISRNGFDHLVWYYYKGRI